MIRWGVYMPSDQVDCLSVEGNIGQRCEVSFVVDDGENRSMAPVVKVPPGCTTKMAEVRFVGQGDAIGRVELNW